VLRTYNSRIAAIVWQKRGQANDYKLHMEHSGLTEAVKDTMKQLLFNEQDI